MRAKDALGLESVMENTRVVECLSELADLKEVWDALMEPFQTLEGIKDTSWSSAVMRKVRRGLDDLLATMRSLPNRIRQYDAYVRIFARLRAEPIGNVFALYSVFSHSTLVCYYRFNCMTKLRAT